MKYLVLFFFHILTVGAIGPKKLVNDVLHFFSVHYIIIKKLTLRNTVHFSHVTSVLKLELCMRGLEMHLKFCWDEFWIYLHICSPFKSTLLYRINKIMFTAFPFQSVFVPLLSGQPLLSGHFFKSRWWPLNRGRTVFNPGGKVTIQNY